jgi:cell division protein FtsN
MAQRDYKNSEPRRNGSTKSNRKGNGLLKGVLVGVFLSLLMAGVLLWMLWPRPQDFKKVASAPELKPSASAIATPAKPVTDASKPTPTDQSQPNPSNYTFYDILPGDKAPKPLPAKPSKEQWWLQVAALKSASDADELRARLALLNFSTVVKSTTKDDVMFYRVRVGPFADKSAADSAQKKLSENKFEARPLKEAVAQ